MPGRARQEVTDLLMLRAQQAEHPPLRIKEEALRKSIADYEDRLAKAFQEQSSRYRVEARELNITIKST